MHTMLYLKANSDIPWGRITSSARKGRKWFDLVKPGDVIRLETTEEHGGLGWAAVVKVELVAYFRVLQRANENHTGQRPLPEGKRAHEVLEAELRAAYGDIPIEEEFTMVHFIRLNERSR